jgi:hypothetical protein
LGSVVFGFVVEGAILAGFRGFRFLEKTCSVDAGFGKT